MDLGNLSAACITVPDTCGSDGAALSMWVKPQYQEYGGVISSFGFSTGLLVAYYRSFLR